MILRPAVCLLIFSALALAQSREANVLGGPCIAEDSADIAQQAWQQLVSRHAEESRRGNREAAVALAKQIVRSHCSNEHWWHTLAESLAELDRPKESVATLEALYARRSNAVDAWLRTTGSPLNRLLKSDAYRSSALAAKLADDRRSLEKRRSEAQARLGVGPHPPVAYVAKPACPFECCGFGRWSVLQDTTLYDSPRGTRVIGRVSKGERVEALTGEVHLRPLPVRVRFSSPFGFTAAEGSIVYLLDYLGEGSGHVWINGKIVDSEIVAVQEHCAFPGADCWGEFVAAEDARTRSDAVWWVKVKLLSGAVGWTRNAGHFGGKDKCG
jgi:hypothetical protein